MHKLIIPRCGLYLAGLLMTSPLSAQSCVDQGAREFDELRLRQLQTAQAVSEITPFATDRPRAGPATG